MEPSTSDKFWAALQNSWRRASVIVAAISSAFLSWYMTLPAVCTGEGCTSQQGLLQLLHIPAGLLPFVLSFIPVLIAVSVPQPTFTAKVREDAAKKAEK